jgi:hypothetical protein
LDRIGEQAEAFFQELLEEYYNNLAGHKAELSLRPIYARYSSLFAPDTVGAFLAATTDPSDKERLYLREFVVEGFLENKAKELTEEVVNRETQATVSWEDRRIPLRMVAKEIAAEPDMERRHRLDEERRRVNSAINPYRLTRWGTLYSTVRELGFANYAEAMDTIKNLKLDWLQPTMEDLLQRTEADFRSQLLERLQEIQVPLETATKADMSRILRAPHYDVLFPREMLTDTLVRTLYGMGLDIRAQANIVLDTEPRPLKSPRAFCAPIQVPDRIMLVINPQGGQDDYQALLHEAGHAEHFAHTDPSLPVAYRRLGDNSVTETYAFLFHYLTIDPNWLQTYLPDGELTSPYISFARFVKLYMLRRYAAKLLYEIDIHSTHDLEGAPSKYANILSRHLLVRHFPEDYLTDVDDGFYAAQYLRAWMLEAQLRAWLKMRHGQQWWAQAASAADLVHLWHFGQKYDALELAQHLGYTGLTLEPILSDLQP